VRRKSTVSPADPSWADTPPRTGDTDTFSAIHRSGGRPMAEARTQPLVTAAPPSAARTPPGGIQSSAISLVTVRRQALTPDRIQLFGQQKARSASCTDPRHQAGEQPAVQTGDDLPDDGAGAFQPDRREASRSGSGAAARLCGRCSVGVTALAARRHGADQDAKTRTTWNATSAWSLTPSRSNCVAVHNSRTPRTRPADCEPAGRVGDRESRYE